MKSRLMPDLQAVSDDPVFSITADEIGPSFIPGPEPGNAGTNGANAPRGILAAALSSNPDPGPMSEPGPDSTAVAQASTLVVPISSGGITINLLFDNAATNIAPASFRAGIEQGATSDGGVLSGASTVLQAAGTGFHQDLNGDGVIGVPHDGGPDGVPPGSGPAGDSFVFQTNPGTSSVTETANANTADFPIHSFGLQPIFSSSGPAAALQMLIEHLSNPHDLSISQHQLTSLLHVADLHAGVFCFINR